MSDLADWSTLPSCSVFSERKARASKGKFGATIISSGAGPRDSNFPCTVSVQYSTVHLQSYTPSHLVFSSSLSLSLLTVNNKIDRMSSTKKVTAEPLTDAEIDHLLANLTSDEIEKLDKCTWK